MKCVAEYNRQRRVAIERQRGESKGRTLIKPKRPVRRRR